MLSPATVLNHEADHAQQKLYNPEQLRKDIDSTAGNYKNKEEKRVIEGVEQDTARKLGEINEGAVTRTDDHGVGLIVKDPTSTVPVNEVQVIATNKEKDEKNK